MDTSHNSAHHVQVGRTVKLVDLSRTEFNGRRGIVLGFYPDKARFAVRLGSDVTPKLFKGKNLQIIYDGWEEKHGELVKRLNHCKGLKEIFAMKNEIEENCAFNEADVFIRYYWINHAKGFSTERKIIEELLEFCDELLKKSNFFSQNVRIKFRRSSLLNVFGEEEKSFELLKSCINDNFGNLPLIATLLISNLLKDVKNLETDKFCLDLIEKCDILIHNGNYDLTVNIPQYLDSKFSYYCAHLENCSNPSAHEYFLQAKKTHKEAIKFENETLEYLKRSGQSEVSVVNEGDKYYRKAQLLRFEGKFEESLECSRKAHECFARDYGDNDSLMTLPCLIHNCLCYYELGDKKKAEKMIKRLKRIDPNNKTLKVWETKVAAMRQTSSVKRKTDKVCGKCSNPFCENIESKLGEFQVCGKCRRTKYCNFSTTRLKTVQSHIKKFLLRLSKLSAKTLERRT